MNPGRTPEDRTIASVATLVVASGAVIGVVGLTLSGPRFLASTAIGTAIAVANFLVLARVVRAFTEEDSRSGLWALAYLFKIAALFGGLFLILRSGYVSLLGVVAGLTSLVPGIVLGGVAASSREP